MFLRKKDSDLVSFFIFSGGFSTAFAIMSKLYAPIHIPLSKDDFILCMVIGSAMNLNGVLL